MEVTFVSGQGAWIVRPADRARPDAWKSLVGESPDSPKDFVVPLLAKDNGWLAAYFDALSRASQSQAGALHRKPRLRHFLRSFSGAID